MGYGNFVDESENSLNYSISFTDALKKIKASIVNKYDIADDLFVFLVGKREVSLSKYEVLFYERISDKI